MGKTHRGKRGGGRKTSPIYDKALAVNGIEAAQYLQWITSLALMRYEWEGLPDTCSPRFLEQTLLYTGHATIARDKSGAWLTLQASNIGELNPYGDPVRWQCIGMNGRVYFESDWSRGVYMFDRKSRACLWAKLSLLADKLARYSRTENVNLLHQFTPYLITAPDEQVQSVQNVFAQVVAGQPAIVGYDSLSDLVSNGIQAIQTNVEWRGDKLQAGALGVWGEVFRILGIPHLQYEKRERLITDEAETTLAPTRLALMDGLEGRREVLGDLARLGIHASVRINPVIERLFEGEPQGGEVSRDE